MPRRDLSLLMAPMLAAALALATASPVGAADVDGDVACPCWTETEARQLVDAALAANSGEDYRCDSDIDVLGTEKTTDADFVVVGDLGRELDLEATLLINDGEVLRRSCSVEAADEFFHNGELTPAEVRSCVRILGQICLENLPTGPAPPNDCGGNEVLICHVPPGNPGNAHEICVGSSAVSAHFLNHGDTSGACPDDDESSDDDDRGKRRRGRRSK